MPGNLPVSNSKILCDVSLRLLHLKEDCVYRLYTPSVDRSISANHHEIMPIGPKLTRLDGLLPDDEIHVWHTSLDMAEEQIARLLLLLDSGEQARAARFLVADARRQYVISHAFLRITLGQYLHMEPQLIPFGSTGNGKPELAGGSGLHFNLSHTEGTAAIIVARKNRVGIDIEKVRSNLEPLELAARFFSRQECEWLRSRPSSQQLAAFFSCWTAKESYIKAAGAGLSMELADFTIIPELGNARLQLEVHGRPEESRKWLIWQLDVKAGTCAAITAETGDVSIRIGEWSAFL